MRFCFALRASMASKDSREFKMETLVGVARSFGYYGADHTDRFSPRDRGRPYSRHAETAIFRNYF